MFATVRQFAVPALYVSAIGAFLLLGVGGMLLLSRPIEALQSLLGGIALFGVLSGLGSLLEGQAEVAASLARLATTARPSGAPDVPGAR
jgi:L-asparagine transporter-like permease